MVPISKSTASTMKNNGCRDVQRIYFVAPTFIIGQEGNDDDDDGDYDYAPAAWVLPVEFKE